MTIKSLFKTSLARSIYDWSTKFEREQAKFMLSLILVTLGPHAAIRYFQRSPLVRRTPARRNWLKTKVTSMIGEEGQHFWALNMLLANPGAREFLDYLALETTEKTEKSFANALPKLLSSVDRNPDTGIMVIGTLVEQGKTELAKSIFDRVQKTKTIGRGGLLRAYCALCPRPLNVNEPDHLNELSFNALFPKQCRHRLIVLSEPLPASNLKHLAHGADKVTIIQFLDLYGKIDLAELRTLLPNTEITIEHARSRADRFEYRYFDIHQKTARCARAFVEAATDLWEEFLPPETEHKALAPLLELEIADKLFFSAIRSNAIVAAVRDSKFDDVIISFNQDFRLFRLICTCKDIINDDRVNGCCWSTNRKVREKYSQKLKSSIAYMDLFNETTITIDSNNTANASQTLEVKKYLDKAYVTRRTLLTPYAGKPRIVLFATQDRAYIGDIAKLACGLTDQYDIDVFWGIRRFDYLTNALRDACEKNLNVSSRMPGIVSMPHVAPGPSAVRAFNGLLKCYISFILAHLVSEFRHDEAVISSVLIEVETHLANTMLTALGRIHAGCGAIKKYEYSAALFCSARTSINIQQTIAARKANIPTIAIEPHCLNASYCRYGTLPTDLAVVFSDYFAEEYDRYFGIRRDRIKAIGSPRFIRPDNYEADTETVEARKALGLTEFDQDIVFVAMQPLPDELAADGIRRISRACLASAHNVRILIKPHPEEGQSRVEMYKRILAEEDANQVCEIVADADFKTLLLASSTVLVFYSVTAIEAAIHERPVIVVGFEGQDYPVPYSDILGVPLCIRENEITEALDDALENGLSSRSGADAFRTQHPYLLDSDYFDRLGGIISDVIDAGGQAIRPLSDLPRTPFVTAPFTPYFSERSL
ncbi:CDP-glycerol glycerophosphotransferase family protein [Roseibium sp. FZY0029]|uniref:CDP-glycerol glycerophosphotransferase family protein n=1 Tax=Roseibium sp. FZY0029 TaxID=3116647 RepID=UPI002E9B2BCD|nr:CDP-glycerol glycerophosphotransferase family protein [Roseibium sp. FZY0029]